MNSDITYELQIIFSKNNAGLSTKEAVIIWLKNHQITNFMEGAVDNLDLDHEYGLDDSHFYEENGGDSSPISLFGYDQEYFSQLGKELSQSFTDVQILHKSMNTKSWQTDWQDSFPPIITDHFFIHPPWLKPDTDIEKHTITIDPGIAFGSGHHESTRLCVRLIESLKKQSFKFSEKKIVDIGTGSGILAICLAKLGSKHLWATDLDQDAVRASRENAKINHVHFTVGQGSIPAQLEHEAFDLIVSNILYVVLKKLIPAFAKALKPSGKIILSGLLEENAEDLINYAKEHKLFFVESITERGWLAVILQKQ